jgi:hypothetical protein
VTRIVARMRQWWAGRQAHAPRATGPVSALDAACARHQCQYSRTVFPTGEVQVTLMRADATMSAVGATTKDAVERVVAKVDAAWGTR